MDCLLQLKSFSISLTFVFRQYVQRGFLARTIQLIFQLMKQTENLSLRVSALEIYNEQLTDLLRESSSTEQITGTSSFATTSSSTKLTIVETAAGIQVPSLFIVPVISEDDAYSGSFLPLCILNMSHNSSESNDYNNNRMILMDSFLMCTQYFMKH